MGYNGNFFVKFHMVSSYKNYSARITNVLISYIVYKSLQTTQYRCGEEAGGKLINILHLFVSKEKLLMLIEIHYI